MNGSKSDKEEEEIALKDEPDSNDKSETGGDKARGADDAEDKGKGGEDKV